ncbi:MJ1255/VC2487 family glycosyltransferase [Pseudomaricurvus sp. HS19]|uniref:MJ1255/VC2487 family glycosyltransferase n=1 Tax=Pseudomaricurvus sp. HS19 TaxID=2692626 RepID=UPI00136EE967|nr:MJ1255/VC2487 family glycosyltransferase [Pseudomaricurvus sp. HS19]MYM62185.1 glycosyltransferase [Pseudomaricurvus sp. HS19]
MKIFYGVQGTGNGHISRARAMNHHLRNSAASTQFLFSGREPGDFFDMDEFGDWRCLPGLTFATANGRIQPLKTFRDNQLLRFWRDVRELDLSGYDLVIHDFEPVTAWAARRQGIPTIGIGHQYAFSSAIPTEGDSLMSRALIRHFAPADVHLGLHWHHFGQTILPPIVHLDESIPVQREEVILVYLGFEAPEAVLQLLHQCPDTRFVYYGKFAGPSEEGNVSLRPLSVEGFRKDLHRCRGVVCNAGFELVSEALQLGKKVLVKPLQGQMEQLSNAAALEELDLGCRMNRLDAARLQEWLEDRRHPLCHYPDVAAAIVKWILSEQRSSVEDLSSQLWQASRLQRRGPATAIEAMPGYS